MSEAVNHPSHYQTKTGIEVIEMIEALGFGEGFSIGSAIKYAGRAGKKDPTKYVEDLEKAVWYLRRRIEIAKAEAEGRPLKRPNDMNPRKEDPGTLSIHEYTQNLIQEQKERERNSSVTSASTSEPSAPQLEPAPIAREIADMTIHGTWYEITPEGQDKRMAFIPDEHVPALPERLEWLAGLDCTVKVFLDGRDEGERPIDYVRGEHA